jgi:DNA-binding CsgD family transcriptional regulator
LIDFGAQVRFGHPLVRSAVYGAAAPEERQRVHCALAEATDADADPDRRAWHRAQAAAGLDEDVAAELERSAGRARARGGLAAGAAFHECAVVLTPDPRRRAQRALLAAQGKHQAGAPDAALRLLAMAQAGPLDKYERARTHLLYGEWLRRENRRVDAREQLRVAHTMLAGMGMEAFAERARRELLATGETVRKRTVDTVDELTPQEVQVARLAADGQTNPEIGAQLFLSPRTVEWHLGKVFGKLGVSSRKELRAALSDVGAAVVRL